MVQNLGSPPKFGSSLESWSLNYPSDLASPKLEMSKTLPRPDIQDFPRGPWRRCTSRGRRHPRDASSRLSVQWWNQKIAPKMGCLVIFIILYLCIMSVCTISCTIGFTKGLQDEQCTLVLTSRIYGSREMVRSCEIYRSSLSDFRRDSCVVHIHGNLLENTEHVSYRDKCNICLGVTWSKISSFV
jgi:hypothetical protein